MDSCASELGTVLCARVAQLQEGIASSGGTPKLASQIQKQIDDDMKEIMHAARAILYLRNTLSLISRLPPELLARIFSFLFTEFASGSSSSTSPGKSTIPVWLAATHVCGLWRQVALDNPSLWSHNIGAIRGWVPEQLSRSQQVPISITNNPNLRDIRTMEVALREIHRARRINLHFTTRGDRKVLQYMEQSAPLLEHLSISMAVPSSIPRNILQHDAPLLTCLELRNCAPPKVLTLYRNLVKLSIHEGYMAQDLLVSVLASIPRLQFLDITNADGKRFRSTARLVDPHAAFSPTLPSTLHTLILTDSPDNIRWLWDHVHLLSSPRTRVQCTKSILPLTAHTRRDTPWQVQKWLPSRTTEAKNPSSIRTLAINCLGMSWSMDGWTQIVTTSDKTTDAVSRVDTFLDSHCLFHFESAGPPISLNGAFAAKVHATSNSKAIIDALYVEGVAAVHLEEPNDQWLHVPKGWESFLVPLRSVQYLSIEGRSAYYALIALRKESAPTMHKGDKDPYRFHQKWNIFPSLRHLSLRRVDLFQKCSGYDDPMCVVHILMYVAGARTCGFRGDRIECIEIKECCITPFWIAMLKKLEVIVEWDQKESGCPSRDDVLGWD